MFLELFGKALFSRIKPWLFYILLLFPALLAASYLYVRIAALQALEDSVLQASGMGKSAIEKKERAEQFIRRYSQADPYFLDRSIESLTFLQKERAQIESLLSHPGIADRQDLRRRLEFLDSGQNRLAFTEENVRISQKIKETEEKQRVPVQMDKGDLEQILALIEDVEVGACIPAPNMPQLIVRDFKIKTIESPQQLEIYEVDMEIFKREWIH